jgi:hypothetical protein
LRYGLTALLRTVILMVCRCNLWEIPRRKRRSQILTGLRILVAKVLVPCILSTFWENANPETLACPNDNGMVVGIAS